MKNRNVEHSTVSRNIVKNLPAGVQGALDLVQESNAEEELVEEIKPASSEIRKLVLFGRIVEDFSFGGYIFRISTLNNRQQQELIKKLMRLENEDRLTCVKTYTLATAIESINEVPLPEIYEGRVKDPFERGVEVISNLQSSLVEALYEKYEELVGKSNKMFQKPSSLGEEIKN